MRAGARTIRRAAASAVLGMGMTAGTIGAAAGTAGASTTVGPVQSTWQATSPPTSVRASTDQKVASMQLTLLDTYVMEPTTSETFGLELAGGTFVTFVSGNVAIATGPSTDAATVSPTISPFTGSRRATFELMSVGPDGDLKKGEKIDITTVVVEASGLSSGTRITVTVDGAGRVPVVTPTNAVEVATVASNGKVTASSTPIVPSSATGAKAGNDTISLTNDTGTALVSSVLKLEARDGTLTPPRPTAVSWYKAPSVTAKTATVTVTPPSGDTLTMHVTEPSDTTATLTLTTVRYTTKTVRGRITVETTWKTSTGVEVGAVTPGVNAEAPAAGYWLVASDGGIFTFGTAPFHGSTGDERLNAPIVGMAEDRATGGYWEVAADGGVFSFDAPFHGSTGSERLNAPVVGMAATPTGGGYWLVASDGGIFTFGNARFYGSMGGTRLDAPVVGMAATPTGEGYWLMASDGGIFTFGDAHFEGSCQDEDPGSKWIGISVTSTSSGTYGVGASNGWTAAVNSGGGYPIGYPGCLPSRHTEPGSVVGIAVAAPVGTSQGNGDWLVDSTGRVIPVTTNRTSYGTMSGRHLNVPIVGMAVSYG